MNVRESNRTRHLVIRLDRGDEMPAALVRALDEAEARSAWITGVGSLEAAEIAIYDQARRAYGEARRIDRPTEVIALSGNASLLDGSTILRLSATLARDTDVGLEVFGGQLVWARAFSIELCVTVFDDVALTRAADDRTGLPILHARSVTTGPSATNSSAQSHATSNPSPPVTNSAAHAQAASNPSPVTNSAAHAHAAPNPAPPVVAPSPVRHVELPPAPVPVPAPATTPILEAPALPQRPQRPRDDVEVYPEVGDTVTHFHFGDCTVISSDGDRIRLRQDKDGRMREVALTMLKIELPTVGADGTRHFKLGRKH